MGTTKPPDKTWSPLAQQHPKGDPGEKIEHPIVANPQGMSEQDRILHLERYLAILWDQVWWLSLPADKRKHYESQGYVAPVANFYKPR